MSRHPELAPQPSLLLLHFRVPLTGQFPPMQLVITL
jgi:hypothetical protein